MAFPVVMYGCESWTILIATGEAIPLRGLEGVPGLPGAPQDALLWRGYAKPFTPIILAPARGIPI